MQEGAAGVPHADDRDGAVLPGEGRRDPLEGDDDLVARGEVVERELFFFIFSAPRSSFFFGEPPFSCFVSPDMVSETATR